MVLDRSQPLTPDDLPLEIRRSSGAPIAAAPAFVSDERAAVMNILESANHARVEAVWARLEAGEDFWTVVHQAFKARELTRAELLAMNLHDYKNQPEELKPSVLALALLEAKAGTRTRPARGRSVQRVK